MLKSFYRPVKSDLVLQRAIKRLYGLRGPSTPTVFESFYKSIYRAADASNSFK